MLKNYLIIAWRQLVKNKLYASINVLGLVVGLSIFLFSTLLVAYERSHDLFFENADRTFTVGSLFSPSANIGVNESDGIYTAFAPLIEAEVTGVQAIARTVGREFLISVQDAHYYQDIAFADPALLQILDFAYLEGDAGALEDPTGVMLTRDMALKLFGPGPALGRTMDLDHEHTLHVTAVIENLPPNTHLTGAMFGRQGFDVVAPLKALNSITGYDLEGNFNNLSSGNFTYLLMPEGTRKADLQPQLDGVFDRHFPEQGRDVISGIKVRKLVEANNVLWDAVGMPILETVSVLGLLVLLVAIVNYTNLATAQSLGRSREIGLRKTMGASRSQLIIQFLVESLFVVLVSMVIAVALIELVLPVFNTATDKGLTLDHLGMLPWLLLTTIAVGLVAGSYPAYLITQAAPIDALRAGGASGGRGGLFRSLMLGLQFSITILMLAMVCVMVLQNKKIEDSAEIYPKSQIITLDRLGVDSIQTRLETLRNELERLPAVTGVSYVSQLPYEGSNSSFNASLEAGSEADDFLINQITVDEGFLETFEVPLLTGRFLGKENAADTITEGVMSANVVANELALERLGISSPSAALGTVFYERRGDSEPRALTIVGVTPDQNYQGFHNQIKPTVFRVNPKRFLYGAIRVENVAMGQALSDVERVWDEVIPDYPIQVAFLDDEFNETFQVYQGLSNVLAGFAGVALVLSLIGLFGLAAFMAAGRTKEIGVRKVMGASTVRIVRLLVWQFSRPVLWALLVALPLAYLAANTYLQFFADRITYTGPIVGMAGAGSVLLAWSIVAVHAYRVARENPVHALRYE